MGIQDKEDGDKLIPLLPLMDLNKPQEYEDFDKYPEAKKQLQTCALCEQPMLTDIVMVIQCGHLYHNNCLTKFMNEPFFQGNCKLCNVSIQESSLKKVFIENENLTRYLLKELREVTNKELIQRKIREEDLKMVDHLKGSYEQMKHQRCNIVIIITVWSLFLFMVVAIMGYYIWESNEDNEKKKYCWIY